jgi:hypothetical protein
VGSAAQGLHSHVLTSHRNCHIDSSVLVLQVGTLHWQQFASALVRMLQCTIRQHNDSHLVGAWLPSHVQFVWTAATDISSDSADHAIMHEFEPQQQHAPVVGPSMYSSGTAPAA